MVTTNLSNPDIDITSLKPERVTHWRSRIHSVPLLVSKLLIPKLITKTHVHILYM